MSGLKRRNCILWRIRRASDKEGDSARGSEDERQSEGKDALPEMIAADQSAELEHLGIMAEGSAATNDLADSVRVAATEAAPLLAAMSMRRKKERRKERHAIKREETKLREDAKKLVQLKVQLLKRAAMSHSSVVDHHENYCN